MSDTPAVILAKIKEAKEKQLKELDLSWYSTREQLTQIPSDLFELEHLEKLNLRNNNIKIIPQEISKLKNLKYLDLFQTQELTEIPNLKEFLPTLEFLGITLDINQTVPEWLKYIPDLGLDFSKDKIKEISNLTANFKNLKLLRVWWYSTLENLPSWFQSLDKLELDLHRNWDDYSNKLTSVPETIGQLTNLTTLDLRTNELKTLPETIGQLTNLTTLYLGYNQLTTLPKAIGQRVQSKTVAGMPMCLHIGIPTPAILDGIVW